VGGVDGGVVLGGVELPVVGGVVPLVVADKPGKAGAVDTGTLPGTFGRLFAFL